MPWWNAIAGPNPHLKKTAEPYPLRDAVVGTQSTKKQKLLEQSKDPEQKTKRECRPIFKQSCEETTKNSENETIELVMLTFSRTVRTERLFKIHCYNFEPLLE